MTKSQQKAYDNWCASFHEKERRHPYDIEIFEAGIKYKKQVSTKERRQEAEEIIHFLNKKTGRNYPCNVSNLTIVCARLAEGFTKDQIMQVIVRKGRDWLGGEMDNYMRPKTLFGATNFGNYVGELV